ncbi:uncharacterized protein UTRI_06392_B [Ustilago trichophora]|uniref:Uncharacterized protein n=1 Tax=Ustilago trichophora TaxID=86804 RepID=A0A5C3EQ74_9BASI|nr:uncharacterized protein UTRI_06392_B [Ustilago trichophora]
MSRTAVYTIFALAILLITVTPPTHAQQGAPPFTTDNSQPACVEFGSCSTAGGSNVATATQNAPVTAPAGTPALATFTTLDSSFISSLAAAGASAAFTGNGGGGSAAQPRTVTSTASRGRATSSGSGSGSGNGSGNGGSSGGSSTMGLGGLGSANAATSVMEVKTAVIQLVAVGVAAVAGAAVLL